MLLEVTVFLTAQYHLTKEGLYFEVGVLTNMLIETYFYLILSYLILVLFQVAQQCRENIFAIQTLKDFQYFDESKDQGMNVREKAKQLVLLLKDDERLRNERARALKAKERFAQAASGFGSEGMVSEVPEI